MMLSLIFVLMVGSIMLITIAFLGESVTLAPEIRREMHEGEIWSPDDYIRPPLALTALFYPLNKLLLAGRFFNRRAITSRLYAADVVILPEDFLGIKELIILVLSFASLLFTKKFEPWIVAALALLGYVLPDLFLNIRIQKRKREITRSLPDAIDLLALCVQGGLDLMRGLTWVVRRSKQNALIKEFSLVIHEVKMGKTRRDAFKSMAKRLELPEIFSFVNTILLTDRMGTPISEILSSLSEESRRRRFQHGERLALQAPIKMLFPLILFILPAVAIIVGAPVLLQFMKSGGIPKF